jgi:TM2 domain-containing membrane protein YozV
MTEIVVTKKSPGIAVLLSFLIAGAGSMYSERIGKGIAIFICAVIGMCIFVIPGIIVWIVGMVMAHSDAVSYNEKLEMSLKRIGDNYGIIDKGTRKRSQD